MKFRFKKKLFINSRHIIQVLLLLVAQSSTAQCPGPEEISASRNPHLLKDINPCAGSSNPNYIVKAGNYTFFNALNGISNDAGLYRSDGTDTGTIKLNLVSPGFISTKADFITPLGNKVIFVGDNYDSYYEIWVSDGTQAGTIGLENFVPPGGQMYTAPIAMGNYVYYTVHTSTGKIQLRRTDGTAAGTTLVKEFDTDNSGSFGIYLPQVMNNTLYFDYYSPINYNDQIWKSDGTSAGTQLVKILPDTLGLASYFMPSGSNLYFTVVGTHDELWKTDGSTTGTVMIKTINPTGTAGNTIYPSYIAFNDGNTYKLILSLNDEISGKEPWITDGTSSGTHLITDIYTGASGSNPLNYILLGGKVYFSASNATNGNELWSTDGTSCNLFSDIAVGATSSNPGPFINCEGRLFFAATINNAGAELWTTDGISTNTAMVKDISVGSTSSSPYNFCGTTYPLYFSATTPVGGRELYKIEALDKLWVGGVGSSWNASANWSPTGVPTTNDKVLIPQSSTSQGVPNIILNASGVAKKIWVNNGNLTIPAGMQLIVH